MVGGAPFLLALRLAQGSIPLMSSIPTGCALFCIFKKRDSFQGCTLYGHLESKAKTLPSFLSNGNGKVNMTLTDKLHTWVFCYSYRKLHRGGVLVTVTCWQWGALDPRPERKWRDREERLYRVEQKRKLKERNAHFFLFLTCLHLKSFPCKSSSVLVRCFFNGLSILSRVRWKKKNDCIYYCWDIEFE